MILPRVFGLEGLASSAPSSVASAPSFLSSSPSLSPAPSPALRAIFITTVYEVIYVVAQTAPAPATTSSDAPTATGTASAASGLASAEGDLSSYAGGNKYAGLTFAGFSAILLSLFLTVLVVTTIAAFLRRQAKKMREFAETGSGAYGGGDLSELGLGNAGAGKMQRSAGEKRGLLGKDRRASTSSASSSSTSDSSDGDEDVKL
ncbi:hypothetical protein JCM10213_009047 [Rhodosporidiobolus nylandii]